MDKEQRKRAAEQSIIVTGNDDLEVEYSVQVSGDAVELHRVEQMPWEDEHGNGPDEEKQVWSMSKGELKDFVAAVQWCIQKSEAYELAHPAQKGE